MWQFSLPGFAYDAKNMFKYIQLIVFKQDIFALGYIPVKKSRSYKIKHL